MKPSTGSRNDIGWVPARQAWIPLKDRETVLMMHEIAVRSINVSEPVRFGLPKFLTMGRTRARGLGKGPGLLNAQDVIPHLGGTYMWQWGRD